jgi:hypothetical protein
MRDIVNFEDIEMRTKNMKIANALLAIKKWDAEMTKIQFAKIVLKTTITFIALGVVLMLFHWGKTGFVFLFVGGMSIIPCLITREKAKASEQK